MGPNSEQYFGVDSPTEADFPAAFPIVTSHKLRLDSHFGFPSVASIGVAGCQRKSVLPALAFTEGLSLTGAGWCEQNVMDRSSELDTVTGKYLRREQWRHWCTHNSLASGSRERMKDGFPDFAIGADSHHNTIICNFDLHFGIFGIFLTTLYFGVWT